MIPSAPAKSWRQAIVEVAGVFNRILQKAAIEVWALALCVLIGGCGTPYSSREHLTLTAPTEEMAALMLRNAVGPVTLTADPNASEVRAEIVKIGKGSSPAQADAALAQIEVALTPLADRPETIAGQAEHPHGGPIRNYEVEWRLTAPPGMVLDVLTNVGKVAATGFSGSATFKTDVGDIEARGQHVGLSAQTGVGDIYAEAAGRIKVRTDVGDATLRVLPGEEDDVTARTQVGELTVELPEGRQGHVKANTDVGSLRIRLKTLTLGGGNVHNVEADLGGASHPTIELSTDVGDLTVQSYAP